MNKAIKYRIYPTKTQIEFFTNTFNSCRFVYNQALEWRISAYKADKTSLTYNDTAYGLTAIKKIYPWLREADSIALQQSLRHLDDAYKNFFARKKNGFPKFKSRRYSKKSYTTLNQNGTVAIVDDKYIKLPKAGMLKAVLHRLPDKDWSLRSATVSVDGAGAYHVSLLFEYETLIKPVPISSNAIGLDYKSDGLYVDSDGNVGSQHKYFRESQAKLAKQQRRLCRKVVGSNNYQKQKICVAKLHRYIANSRIDHLHKLSSRIADRYDAVCVEDIDMKAMSRCLHLGKATMDNGYGTFVKMLEYKLMDRGKYLVKVDRWYPSSQLCNCCGFKNPVTKDLRVITVTCPCCGKTYNRDHNSALNIRDEGLRILKSKCLKVG